MYSAVFLENRHVNKTVSKAHTVTQIIGGTEGERMCSVSTEIIGSNEVNMNLTYNGYSGSEQVSMEQSACPNSSLKYLQ